MGTTTPSVRPTVTIVQRRGATLLIIGLLSLVSVMIKILTLCNRYYHVFREGEIDHMIEKYVENLHIISSYYDHANWCIVAEKVNVWSL